MGNENTRRAVLLQLYLSDVSKYSLVNIFGGQKVGFRPGPLDAKLATPSGRSPLLKLNEPPAEGRCRCFRAAQDVKLRENAAQMALDGCFTDEKLGRDFLVTPTAH